MLNLTLLMIERVGLIIILAFLIWQCGEAWDL